VAFRAKIGPDETEPEGFGGSKVEGENEVWPDFRRSSLLEPGKTGSRRRPGESS
jgi:hypothetical protein